METNENNNGFVRSVFFFDEMLMPKLITFVYWLLLVGVVLSSLSMMVSDSIIGGLLAFLFGTIGARLWCELMIVLFKINENMQKLADKP